MENAVFAHNLEPIDRKGGGVPLKKDHAMPLSHKIGHEQQRSNVREK